MEKLWERGCLPLAQTGEERLRDEPKERLRGRLTQLTKEESVFTVAWRYVKAVPFPRVTFPTKMVYKRVMDLGPR